MTDVSTTANVTLAQEVAQELAAHKVLVYSKGTKDMPRCGFTAETVQFFNQLGCDSTFIDVLDNPEKRQYLSELTEWPTLPKVFINGKFYGDTDILGPMAQNGELQTLLKEIAL